MAFQEKYWGMCFTLIALYFTLYTVAKDYVSYSDDTILAVLYAFIFWVVLLAPVIILALVIMVWNYFKPKE